MKTKSGFTLIELLVVISIIGVLTGLLLTNLQGVRERARDGRRKSDLDAVSKSLRLYYNDNQVFPDSVSGAIEDNPWGGSFTGTSGTVYMNYLPTDPSGDGSTYSYYSSGDQYVLVSTLENPADPDIEVSQDACDGLTSLYNPGTNPNYLLCVE